MRTKLPICNQKREECFAFRDGHCKALTDCEFDQPCPFFKPSKRKQEQKIKAPQKQTKPNTYGFGMGKMMWDLMKASEVSE